ncbi:acyclic terpene utilization AtuA family protein [Fluviispira multicolorata]|uniref:Acyclic terpene utilization AtuA family protein n=1 Tax=Fluviispira multicolorata TaxID=2654512 RepID=A0A833JFD2_9BACT|nr:acyclic terpene utilization AtuA family protein [Fluviispira multicolorata]KAB8033679.1 acyclic terpene utilization AtuA family protein [Fluviispira multicolorata]
MSKKEFIRIANAGGYWGDDPYALRRQVFGELKLDYISIDFLAEITMSILQKQRAKDPNSGYAKDFINALDPVLEECLKRKIKIITNAGGVNPRSCAEALFNLARKKNLNLKVAVIDGDDIFTFIPSLRTNGVNFKNMETEEDFSNCADRVLCANTYFGALPVAEALKNEPDIVLCGRVTDTGITLAAMMHEFNWKLDDYDKLAHGIVAGHIIECGAQASGGNFTDWQKVPSFIDIGFPIVECYNDGSFYVTKHPNTGGIISCQTIREQLLYEMGTPQSYITPDVIADFSTIQLSSEKPERVKVTGIKGRKPTDLLKVSIAYEDGYKCSGTLIISGPDVRAKAEMFAKVFWLRLESELKKAGFPSTVKFKNTEYVGDDSTHKGMLHKHEAIEILLKLTVRDHDKDKLNIFRKLLPSLILSGPSGVAVTGGAPIISEVVSYWPALIPQECALPNIRIFEQKKGDDKSQMCFEKLKLNWPLTGGNSAIEIPIYDPFSPALVSMMSTSRPIRVSLMEIAHARSGDKGDTVNIGLIGRSPECYVWLRENITAEKVNDWFHSLCKGEVHRYLVPNLWALNFLLEESLGGGGTMSLQIDAQGKTFSQALLRCEVDIPEELLTTILPEFKACAGELVRRNA